MNAVLEVMSGPADGEAVPIHAPVVRLGPCEGSLLSLSYDPLVPKEGVELKVGEEGVWIGPSMKDYGEIFQVGQTWLRVVAAPQEGHS